MPEIINTDENGKQTVKVQMNEVETLVHGAFHQNVLVALFLKEDDCEFFIKKRLSVNKHDE